MPMASPRWISATRSSCGTCISRRSPGATSITTSATPTTSRCARLLEAVLTHAAHVEPRVLAEIRRYTKLFWINTGPYNNLTARKFVLRADPRRAAATAVAAAQRDGAVVATRPGESLAALVDRLAPMFFDAERRSDPDQQDARERPRHPGGELEQPVCGRDDARARRLSRALRLEFAPDRCSDGRLVEDVYRVGGRYDREIRRIVRHLSDAVAYAPPRHGGGACRADPLL